MSANLSTDTGLPCWRKTSAPTPQCRTCWRRLRPVVCAIRKGIRGDAAKRTCPISTIQSRRICRRPRGDVSSWSWEGSRRPVFAGLAPLIRLADLCMANPFHAWIAIRVQFPRSLDSARLRRRHSARAFRIRATYSVVALAAAFHEKLFSFLCHMISPCFQVPKIRCHHRRLRTGAATAGFVVLCPSLTGCSPKYPSHAARSWARPTSISSSDMSPAVTLYETMRRLFCLFNGLQPQEN